MDTDERGFKDQRPGDLCHHWRSDGMNYLRITGLRRAVQLNFGTRSLEYKRLIFTPDRICADLRKSVEHIRL